MSFKGTITNQLGTNVNLIAEYEGLQSAYDNETSLSIQLYIETLQDNMAVQFGGYLNSHIIESATDKTVTLEFFAPGLINCARAGKYELGPLQNFDAITHLITGDLSSPLLLGVSTMAKITIFQDNAEIESKDYIIFQNDLNVPNLVRHASVQCSSAYIGDFANIKINSPIRGKGLYRLSYTCGDLTGHIIDTKETTVSSWRIPVSFLEMAGEDTVVECTLTCETYDLSGEDTVASPLTLCGTDSTTFLVMKDVYGYSPLITFTAYAPTSGYNQYYNSVTIYFSVNINSRSSGTLTKVRATCDGQSVEWLQSDNYPYFGGYSGLFNCTFTNVSNPTVKVEAWDSNNFYGRSTYMIPGMVPYSLLTCHLFTHTVSPSGTTSFTVEGNCHNGTLIDGSVNKFNGSYAVYAKDSPDTPSISGKLEPELSEYSNYSVTIDITGLDYQKEYFVSVIVNDNLMETQALDVIRNMAVFDWNENNFRFNVETVHREPVLMGNSTGISFAKTPADNGAFVDYHNQVEVLNFKSDDTTHLGYGGYQQELGATKIYGNEIDLISNHGLTINGRGYGEQKVLWEGSVFMHEGHTITLPEAISDQPSGIILVFSLFRNGAAEDVSINSFFVSKKEVELLPGAPHFFLLGINSGFSSIGGKYIYIDNYQLIGQELNNDSGSSVINFTNGNYVLRYVIGV